MYFCSECLQYLSYQIVFVHFLLLSSFLRNEQSTFSWNTSSLYHFISVACCIWPSHFCKPESCNVGQWCSSVCLDRQPKKKPGPAWSEAHGTDCQCGAAFNEHNCCLPKHFTVSNVLYKETQYLAHFPKGLLLFLFPVFSRWLVCDCLTCLWPQNC